MREVSAFVLIDGILLAMDSDEANGRKDLPPWLENARAAIVGYRDHRIMEYAVETAVWLAQRTDRYIDETYGQPDRERKRVLRAVLAVFDGLADFRRTSDPSRYSEYAVALAATVRRIERLYPDLAQKPAHIIPPMELGTASRLMSVIRRPAEVT